MIRRGGRMTPFYFNKPTLTTSFWSFPNVILLVAGELELEATLDRQLYHHGDSVVVNISVRNNSNKMVKKITASILQCIDIAMFQVIYLNPLATKC